MQILFLEPLTLEYNNMNKTAKLIFIGLLLLQTKVAFSFSYHFSSKKDSLDISSETIDSTFEENLDSLLHLWYVKNSFPAENKSIVKSELYYTELPDSVYVSRLGKIPSVFPLTYNNAVRSFIRVYTWKKKQNLEVMLGLSDYYFPIFEEILDEYKVPVELKYLPIIESALNPCAVSRAGASGLWQFMYGTGRMYDLTVNSFIDDRRDPIKATRAAAKYLHDLYAIYNDWTLVIAAYNCGPANVNKAIRRSGGRKNYWEIYQFLPKETRGYVPAFIGATYAMTYYKEHNLNKTIINLPIATDTIMIHHDLHLMQVAEVLKIPVEQLRDLNPQYRRDIIPGTYRPCPLTIPLQYTAQFIDLQDSIFAYKDSIYMNQDYKLKDPDNYVNINSKHHHQKVAGDLAEVRYTVKAGDNLGLVSSWFNVTIADIRYWNDLRKNVVREGQRLIILVPKGKVQKYSKINTMTLAQKQLKTGKTVSEAPATETKQPVTGDFIYYTVKPGDTLWGIANKNPGNSGKEILKINNLNSASKIIPGQTLKIRKKI